MKQYKATATYTGEKFRSKGKPEQNKIYGITIDEHSNESGPKTYLTLIRPDFSVKVEIYYDSWEDLEQDWNIEKIEEI